MDLISIIVPVYNVAPYLDRCVQSLVDQTYPELEILLIDDGSTDTSGVLCDAWAAKDHRIKVIHKPNGGLSDARNAGLRAATGTYLGFVDSDDYVRSDMYQLLIDRMISDNSDISACGVQMVYSNSTNKSLTQAGSCILSRFEAMKSIISEDWLKQPVWYKLYKTALVRSIPFPVGKHHEDVFWSYQAIANAKQVSVFDSPCYFYLQRSDSIMGKSYSLKRLDAIEGKLQRLDYIRLHIPELLDLCSTDLFFSCLFHGQQAIILQNPAERETALKYLKAVSRKIPIPMKDALSLKQRFWLLSGKLSFRITCIVRNLLGIGR